jgi:hypothetical protein
MAGQRVKANKNRKGKERKIRCNACGYAKVKETPSFLHENLLIVGYANKSDFRELPIGKEVRCSEGSIGLQQNKHFFHDEVYYYHRAPFATVTCLYKRVRPSYDTFSNQGNSCLAKLSWNPFKNHIVN